MASETTDKKSNAVLAKSLIPCNKCGTPSILMCPHCQKLKLPREGASFCSRDCFKESWKSHKVAHADGIDLTEGWHYLMNRKERTPRRPPFSWTGSLQPYRISEMRKVPASIEKPDWAIDGVPKSEQYSYLQNVVEIKTPGQIAKMRATCLLARQAIDAAAREIKPGVSTEYINNVVHETLTNAGGYPSILNYNGFPKSCSISVNEVICNGIPDCRKLKEGDIVKVEVSVFHRGVHGTVAETYFVRNVDNDTKELALCAYDCLRKAISKVKPGVQFVKLGEAIEGHASVSGLSVVKTICGNGIGELFRCAPEIPNYGNPKNIGLIEDEPTLEEKLRKGVGCNLVGLMRAGQTFTVGPMINEGISRDVTWPDGWTTVTADGKRSAQFKHTLLVTETGVEILTARLPESPDIFTWLGNRA